ncbi:DUF4129 domain-containing protein [uncultured Lutibacter sp.]|uniref:DUF4129 domain-containing protein n=1 Tax=uncultured Lutibacter sp. TaxID=437739 RepID=UPI002623C88C|nr:DUF4129 domain-containing protein [uncultured Lutibacter sp.]
MYKSVILMFFLMFFVGIYAQTDSLMVKNDKSTIVQKKFDLKKLNEYKLDKDFDYLEEKIEREPTFLERVFNWLVRQFMGFLEWIFGMKYAKGVFAGILKSIPYIIVGLLLFFILKFFLKVNSNSIVSNSANEAIVTITEDEALIKRSDLLKLISQAIEQKNFRLAIRYYYLNILRQLENKQLIAWEQQKTNEDYIKEISKPTIGTSFKKLTRLYDFVWYGNFEISEIEFSKVVADFQKAAELINKN